MNPLNYFFCFPALFHLLNTSENFNASEKIIIGFIDVIVTVTDVIHLIIGFTCETQKLQCSRVLIPILKFTKICIAFDYSPNCAPVTFPEC